MNRRAFLRGTGTAAISTLDLSRSLRAAALARDQHTQPFEWTVSGLEFAFDFLEARLRQKWVLPHGVNLPYRIPDPSAVSGVEVALHCTGEDAADHHGMKFAGGMPGCRLVFVSKREEPDAAGKRLVITHHDPQLALQVESIYTSFNDIPVVRRHTRVKNIGERPVGIEYLSSAMLHNFAKPEGFEKQLRIHFAHNTWQAEGQWRSVPPSQLGFLENGAFSLSGVFASSIGTWSTEKYLPIAMIENTELAITWFWQIEHNGSWHWELSNTSSKALYAYLGGPDEQHSHAWKNLRPGEIYETVPVALGCVRGGFTEAVQALTRYRRNACFRRRTVRAQRCPVIFNDYMNCLEGDPTTEKELPLIDAAAEAGCEYFVIDAGWYAERNENWWGSVGLWQPSKTRWSKGLTAVLQRIRDKGMIPGLWLEPEVVGVHSPLKDKPDDWFFSRHGRRVIDHERYLLDFRNAQVRAYLDQVVDRLVRDYGIGYIKMDYNVDGLEGTELRADSFGQGLLEHCRAVLAWLDGVLARYPELMVENCASGGGRMDYAMLSRLELQSSSDQTDYRKYPSIMAGASAAVLPEQLAAWSYPLGDADPDQASFNMVSAMLCRIHQSGHLAKLSSSSLAQVKTGIHVYKSILRPDVPNSLPFYPLGLPDITDAGRPVALGMKSPGKTLIGVWRLNGPERVHIPNVAAESTLIYPKDLGIRLEKSEIGLATVFPRTYMACILAS